MPPPDPSTARARLWLALGAIALGACFGSADAAQAAKAAPARKPAPVSAPAAPAAEAPPSPPLRRNFVPLSPTNAFGAEFWDTASPRRSGDEIRFDRLRVDVVYELHAGQPPLGVLQAELKATRVSCGWRTIRVTDTQTFGANGGPAKNIPIGDDTDGLLYPPTPIAKLVDDLCAGNAAPAVTGASSIAATIAAAGVKPMNALPMPASLPRPHPTLPGWLAGPAPHFERVRAAASDGNRLYLDLSSLRHSGPLATGVAVTALNADAQRYGPDAAAVLEARQTLYDCAARTLTVQSSARWSRRGQLSSSGDLGDTPPRANAESPIIAAEIQAVCGSGSPTAAKGKGKAKATPPASVTEGPALASIEAVWADTRASWPERHDRQALTCIFDALPSPVRVGFLNAWTARPDTVRLNAKAGDVQGALASCPGAADKVGVYNEIGPFAAHQAAAWVLTHDGALTEAQLQAAWLEEPWTDRQRYAAAVLVSTAADRDFQKDVVARIAARLKVEALRLPELKGYMDGEARITD